MKYQVSNSISRIQPGLVNTLPDYSPDTVANLVSFFPIDINDRESREPMPVTFWQSFSIPISNVLHSLSCGPSVSRDGTWSKKANTPGNLLQRAICIHPYSVPDNGENRLLHQHRIYRSLRAISSLTLTDWTDTA